jgi:putative endonuclease
MGQMTGGYVYILTNRKNGALYTGVCADIAARMMQHRAGTGSKFCAKYGINRLVYVEHSEEIFPAIEREKAIKKWNRAWKIKLIESANPDWRDLFDDINC